MKEYIHTHTHLGKKHMKVKEKGEEKVLGGRKGNEGGEVWRRG